MSDSETTANGEWSGWRDAWVAEAARPPAPASANAAAQALRRPGSTPASGSGTAARPAADPAGVADLLRRLHRQRLRMLAAAAGEVLAMLVLIAASVAILQGGAVAWKVTWLITLWVFACVAIAFAWWNRRATWRAAGAAVDDAVRLARLRSERQLRTVDFVLLLYAAESVAVVAQLAWFDRLAPTALVALAVGGGVVAAWYGVTRRRLRRELARIDAFARELPDPP